MRNSLFVLWFSLIFCPMLRAEDSIYYVDALNFRMVGKGFQQTEAPYDRLPASLKEKTRKEVWNLSKNSSGLGIRFRSNSTLIALKYDLLDNFSMNHMAYTGIKGADLYCLEKNGMWHYVMTARPKGKHNEMILIQNMPQQEKEYWLFLPLYDGVSSVEIGVKAGSLLEKSHSELPRQAKPVVVYGTSITQGGCASRTGMSYTNILSRKLNREFVNLGFSGNGKLDLEIADAMATIDAGCVVIDCVPNCTVELIEKQGADFVRRIREAHPDMPVVMISGPRFPHQEYDAHLTAFLPAKNAAFKKVFEQLKKENKKNLYFVNGETLPGKDAESTVDGVHLTDLGFMRYADQLYPVLKKLLK